MLDWCFDHLKFTLGTGLAALALMLFLGFSGVIGSEFLPHLDEGAIWVRGTLAPSAGPTTGIAVANSCASGARPLSRGQANRQPGRASG